MADLLELSKTEREALKAIHRSTIERRQGLSADAHTGDLSEELGLTPGTVTSTLKKLADRGLVDHKPYKGVELTPLGRSTAVAAIRRHRIVERFLSDMLGYAWNEADRLAPTFEHALPQEVEARMYESMERPATCPHGFTIPEPEVMELPLMDPLYSLEPGDSAVVALPGSIDAEVVSFLETLGVRPGVLVEVIEKQPFDGPLVIHVDGESRSVGEKVARQIYVRRDSERRREQTA